MASQPPSASTPTMPSDGMAVSAGLYRAVSRIIRSRAPNSLRAGRFQLLLFLGFLAEALHHAHAADGLVDHADDLGRLLLRVPGGREQLAPGRHRDEIQRRAPPPAVTTVSSGDRITMMTAVMTNRSMFAKVMGVMDSRPCTMFRSEMDRPTSCPVRISSWRAPSSRDSEPNMLGPQVVLDVQGDPAAVETAQVDAAEVDRGRDQQQSGQRPDRLVVRDDDVVDDAALHQRYRGHGHRAEQRAAHRDEDVAPVPPAVPRQPPQPPLSRPTRPRRASCPH